MTFARSIHWQPGYDYRNDPEKKQFGQQSPWVSFVVKNDLGALEYQLQTRWYFNDNSNDKPYARILWHIKASDHPLGSIHTADYYEQTPQDCAFVGRCVGSSYSDHENKLMKLLFIGDLEEFWTALETKHKEIIK